MQVVRIPDQAHDNFVKSHPAGSMCQLTGWCRVKAVNGWTYDRVAVAEEGEIRGVAALMFRQIPKTPWQLCYVSQGFVVDWFDEEAVTVLLEEVRRIAKEHEAFVITIDPDLKEDTPGLLEQIESYGFEHQGFTFGFKDAIQPRFHMVTDLGTAPEDIDDAFSGNTRSKIRKAHRYGHSLEEGTITQLPIFQALMEETGQRDGFLIRQEDYFKSILEELGPDDAKLFLVRMDPDQAIQGLRTDIKNRRQEIKGLKKKGLTEQMENIEVNNAETEAMIAELETLGDEPVYLSGAIYVQSGSKAYYLYGASSNRYRDLLPNYFMQDQLMKFAQSQGAKYYDFGGVSGQEGQDNDEAPGLYEFKQRFGSYKRARIGEFDDVLNRPVNKLYQIALDARQKLLSFKKKLNN